MNDVAYRINTSNPVSREGVVVVNNGSRSNLTTTASGSVFYRGLEKVLPSETPGNTGLVDRFDDYKYYTT